MSNSILVSMLICNICATICFSVIAPILPIELKAIDFQKENLGYMFAAYSLASIIGSLICGEILSICGRRLILLVSLVTLGISTIMFSLIDIVSLGNSMLYVVCGIRIIEGISSGFVCCAVFSIVSITYRAEQVKYLAYVEASEAISAILGPAVGSALYSLIGFKMVFLILGVLDLFIASTIMFVVSSDVDIKDEELESDNNENYVVNENNDIATHYQQNVQLNSKQNTECS